MEELAEIVYNGEKYIVDRGIFCFHSEYFREMIGNGKKIEIRDEFDTRVFGAFVDYVNNVIPRLYKSDIAVFETILKKWKCSRLIRSFAELKRRIGFDDIENDAVILYNGNQISICFHLFLMRCKALRSENQSYLIEIAGDESFESFKEFLDLLHEKKTKCSTQFAIEVNAICLRMECDYVLSLVNNDTPEFIVSSLLNDNNDIVDYSRFETIIIQRIDEFLLIDGFCNIEFALLLRVFMQVERIKSFDNMIEFIGKLIRVKGEMGIIIVFCLKLTGLSSQEYVKIYECISSQIDSPIIISVLKHLDEMKNGIYVLKQDLEKSKSELNEMKNEYDRRINDLENIKIKGLEQQKAEYESKIKDLNSSITNLRNDIKPKDDQIRNLTEIRQWIFGSCGASGRFGPNQSQCDQTYGKGFVSVENGIQIWSVPYNGKFRINAKGAQGGNGAGKIGGLGASITGTLSLSKGQKIKILVGQRGGSRNGSDSNSTGAGGGGSFVSTIDNSPLIVAGGGGGAGKQSNGMEGVKDKNGTDSQKNSGKGGLDGGGGGGAQNGTPGNRSQNGGIGSFNCYGSGGGGFYTNGGQCCSGKHSLNGISFISGGTGGPADTERQGVDGGFGGGGAVGHRASGGGGYSGGGGDGDEYGGGGGGSFNSGTDQENLSGVNEGDGSVTINYLGP